MTAPRIFLSYSHEDEEWMKRVRTHLQGLVRQGKIDVWVDTDLRPGQKWRDEIDAALDSAQIALFLISASFLASKFITGVEIPKLLEAHPSYRSG